MSYMGLKQKQRENLALIIIAVVGVVAIGAIMAMLGPVADSFNKDSLTGAATARSELMITPNPCPITEGDLCPVLVKWSVPEAEYSQVWVSMNGGPEMFFSCSEGENIGAELAPWIGRERFEFRLYPAISCEKDDRLDSELARVIATGTE